MEFKIGDEVRWISQAAGRYKWKSGTIIHVQPANEYLPHIYGGGLHSRGKRNHESYVVHVKGEIYWPRVKHLRKVEDKCHQSR